MKWLWIIVALGFLLAGYVPQRRTRLRPYWPAEPRRYAAAIILPRTVIRFEIMRLA